MLESCFAASLKLQRRHVFSQTQPPRTTFTKETSAEGDSNLVDYAIYSFLRMMALACLGLLIIGAIPTVIGVAEAIDGQKRQNEQCKERIKFNLTAEFSPDGELPHQKGTVVFKDNKLYLDLPGRPVSGYKFNGFYFGYPGPENHQGLVSMASDDPPALHWIFADKETGELRHGSRSTTEGHVIGPWNWSEDEQFMALEGSAQCFLAVEGEDGAWSVYYDKTGDLDVGDRVAVDILLRRELQLGVASSYVKDK